MPPPDDMMLITLLFLQSPTLEIGGRFMEDFAFASGGAATSTALGAPFEDGAEVRAARIRVFGDLSPGIGYKMEYDWSDGSASLEDAFLQFDLREDGFLLVGHQDEPFGLDHLTSSRFVTFLERSSPIRTFAPDHNMGVSYWEHRQDWTMGGGVFRKTDSSGKSSDQGYGVTARAVYRPQFERNGRELVHLGVAASWRRPDGPVSYAARPENHLMPAFVDTGLLSADEVVLLGLEAAVQQGPFHGMVEVAMADQSAAGTTEPRLNGFSVQAGWFLTGESRGYDPELAAFDRVVPHSAALDGEEGLGAWEVALRYSTLDLTEAAAVADEMETITAAVNWYPHKHVRVQLNVTQADLASLDGTTIVALRIGFDW